MDASVEGHLRQVAGQGQEAMVAMVRQLSGALIYPDAGNTVTNAKLWDVYAQEWGPDKPWVQTMAKGSGCDKCDVVGDEWAPAAHTQRVLDEWILPEVTGACCEIGCGGGRIAQVVAEKCEELTLVDVSQKMLARTKTTLQQFSHVRYIHVPGDSDPSKDVEFTDFPSTLREAIDFLVCFDVMVHMDLHTIFATLKRIYALLKPNAKAFISTANLLAPDGWNRFRIQSRASVGGFFFTTPDAVRKLVTEAGFTILRESETDPSNIYYHRDFLLLLQKKL